MFCTLGCFDSSILSPYTAAGLAGSLRYIVLCALLITANRFIDLLLLTLKPFLAAVFTEDLTAFIDRFVSFLFNGVAGVVGNILTRIFDLVFSISQAFFISPRTVAIRCIVSSSSGLTSSMEVSLFSWIRTASRLSFKPL